MIYAMQDILEVKNITKNFISPLSFKQAPFAAFIKRPVTKALTDITFSLEKGKILSILGPNGAGKSTLLRILSTLILPDKGEFTINGHHCRLNEKGIKSTVGLILDEERSFYWRLSGRQNLEFFAQLYNLKKKEIKTKITELLELFEADYADKRFYTYSTGMKKRFAIMRGMLHNPQILLLDEPTKSLDYGTASNLKGFIKETLVRKHGKTVIYTTHQIEEASDFADTFLILHKGKISAMGKLEDLRNKANAPEASLDKIFLKLTQNN